MFPEPFGSRCAAEQHNGISIRQLAETKSVLLISHRLANVVGADRIYVMSEGRICETGTHEELMAENGEYHRMFRLQQELESYSAGGAAGEEDAGGESCDMNTEPECETAGDSDPAAVIAAHGDMNVSSIHDEGSSMDDDDRSSIDIGCCDFAEGGEAVGT